MDESISVATKTREVEQCIDNLLGQLNLRRGRFQSTVTPDAVADVRGRFNLWAGNIGAKHAAESALSVESRLAAAGEILEQVLALLEDFTEALYDLSDIVVGRRENRRFSYYEDTAEISSPNDGSGAVVEKEEAQDLLDIAADCARSLLKISILVRKATPRDRFAKALQVSDNPFMDLFDINYVADRYPKLGRPDSSWLCKRLGRAITKRRQVLRYLREHSRRIAEGSEQVLKREQEEVLVTRVGGGNVAIAASTVESKPATRSVQASTKASTLDVAKLDVLRAAEEDGDIDDSGSLFSASASVTSTQNADARLSLPSLVDVRQGNANALEFECPFCLGIKTFTSETAWRRHAFQDLRPYSCTLGEGICEDMLFVDSKSWFEHEQQEHRRQWSCILCQQGPFPNKGGLAAHLTRDHKGIIGSQSQLESFESAGQVATDAIPAGDCPFCDDWKARLEIAVSHTNLSPMYPDSSVVLTVEPKQFRRHVAQHLEQLALFAVPQNLDDNEYEASRSEDRPPHDPTGKPHAHSPPPATSLGDDEIEWLPDPPLHIAAAAGDVDEVLRLLKDGADPHATGETWGTTMKAASSEAVRKVLRDYGEIHLAHSGYSITSDDEMEEVYEIHKGSPTQRQRDALEGSFEDKEREDMTDVQEPELERRFILLSESKPSDANADDKDQGDLSKLIRPADPPGPLPPYVPLKSILKQPKARIPEEPNPVREGVASRKPAPWYPPPAARWTKISRKLVNPEALTIGKERFEVRDDFVIVLRVLNVEEIKAYTAATAMLREMKRQLYVSYTTRTKTVEFKAPSKDEIEEYIEESARIRAYDDK